MTLSNLLAPWLMLAGVLILLTYAEKWVHRHLYGVGWVLTNSKKTATALYYVLLLPGVFVHEFTQYLVAGALNVRIRRVIAWPEAQDNGTLRLNFITIQRARPLERAIIGAAPLGVGLTLVWVISTQILNLEEVLNALLQGDANLLAPALRELGSTPDFYLWLYLMFAIGNAMLPTPADREGWPLVLGVFGVILVFLLIIGVGEVLLQTFTGPVAHGVELLATAFLMVLLVQVPAMIAIAILEAVAGRITGRHFEYRPQAGRSRTRQPGSADPLPPGAPLPSIYNLPLPLPDPERDAGPPPRRQPARQEDKPSTPPAAPSPRPTAAQPEAAPASASPFEQARRTPAPAGRAAGQPPRPVTAGPAADRAAPPTRPLTAAAPLPGSQPADKPTVSFGADRVQPAGRSSSPERPSPFASDSPPLRRPFSAAQPGGDEEEPEDELIYEDFDEEDDVLDDLYDEES
jgi:hypothetical protein